MNLNLLHDIILSKALSQHKRCRSITFSYNLSHISLNLSIYSCLLLINQLIPMCFIPSSVSIRSQTMLEIKDFSSLFIVPCHK